MNLKFSVDWGFWGLGVYVNIWGVGTGVGGGQGILSKIFEKIWKISGKFSTVPDRQSGIFLLEDLSATVGIWGWEDHIWQSKYHTKYII